MERVNRMKLFLLLVVPLLPLLVPISAQAQTFANLEIEVFADDNQYWDGSYCCPAGTMAVHDMGSLSQPLNGTRIFYTTCESNFSIGVRLDYPSSGVILVAANKNGDIHYLIATAPTAITQQYNWINVNGEC